VTIEVARSTGRVLVDEDMTVMRMIFWVGGNDRVSVACVARRSSWWWWACDECSSTWNW